MHVTKIQLICVKTSLTCTVSCSFRLKILRTDTKICISSLIFTAAISFELEPLLVNLTAIRLKILVDNCSIYQPEC